MSKYIDAEKLIAEIQRRIDILTQVYARLLEKNNEEMSTYYHGKVVALEELFSFLDTLEKEQPSLPSELDEAAEAFIEKRYNETHEVNLDDEVAFKAGAEWMAEQGEIHELTVESPILGPPMICCSVNANNGDRVVVQIRKK